MATYYLDATRPNDSGAGTSAGTAWKTWAKAKTVMVAGDTLRLINNASFTGEQFIIDFSGTSATAKIIITSDDPLNPATIDGNYAYPVDPGTGGRTSRNGVRSLFKGLVEIRCPFVDFTHINVTESQGHGIWIFGAPGNRNHDILVEYCNVSHHRSNCIGMQDADRCTIRYNVCSHGSDYISGLTDGVSTGQSWSAIIKTNLGADNTIEYNDVFHGWGEGVILAYGTLRCKARYNRIWDVASGKMYVQRGVDAEVYGNITWDTFDESILKNGTDPSAGLSIRNEQKAGAGTPSTTNVLFANNVSIGHRYNIVVGGSQGGTETMTNVRVFHNILVNARSRSGTAHNSIYFNSNALLSGIEFKNNLIWQPDGYICNTASQRTGVTFTANGWSLTQSLVYAWLRSAQDVYSIQMSNPNATIAVAGIANPEDYRPSVEYAGVSIAEITLDFYGNARASNYMGGLGTTGSPPPPPPVGGSALLFETLGYKALTTSSGNEDVEDATITDTAVAALVFASHATVAGTPVDHWKFSAGAADATSQWVQTSRGQDGQAASVTATQGMTDMVAALRHVSSAAVTHEASRNSLGAGKITLNKAGAQTEAMGTIAALFGGTDCSAKVGTFTNASAINGTVDVTVGFEYNLLFVFGIGQPYDDTNNPDVDWRMGVSTEVASQFSLMHWSDNSAAPVDSRAIMRNDCVGVNVITGQLIKVSARTSTLFTIKTEVATGAVNWGYLALKFSGAKTYVGVDTTPTATGTKKYVTGAVSARFKPGLVIMFQSLLTALNTAKLNDEGSSIGVGLWTDSLAGAISASNQDGVATTQTKTIYDSKPIRLLKHDGTDGIVGAFSSMDSDGATVNHTTVLTTARYAIVVAIEESAALQLTGGLEQGFADDVGILTIAQALTGGLEESYSDDVGILSTVFVPLPPVIVPHLFPSHSRPRRPTIAVYEPLGWGTAQLDDLTAHADSYSHELAAFGGYWSASMRWKDDQRNLEDWLELGLGRRIVTYNPAGSVVWEGFVNSVALRLGELSITRGPLLNIANRVRLTYSWIDPAAGIAIGARAQTDWNDDFDSADRYGNLERMLSTGGVEPTNADILRDLYLEENRRPETSQQISIGGGGGGESSISIECLGYIHYLNTYTYNQTLTTGTIDLSAKLQAVLSADPNGYLSGSFANIARNTTPVRAVDNEDHKAIGIVKDLMANGDGNLNRYLFGVYADRMPEYRAVVEQVDYTRRLSDPAQTILTPGGQIVEPWDVQPGRWLFYNDFLVGRVENSTAMRDDPRAVFLESVTYEAPRTLRLNGNRIRRLDQKLAQLGLSGIGG